MSGISKGLWRAAQNKDYAIDYMLEFFEYDKLEQCDSYINSALYNGVVVIGISEADIEYLNRKEFDLPVMVIQIDNRWIIEVESWNVECGYQAAVELLKQPELPEALFVMADMQALGVVHGLNEAGYRIPDEMSIICYGDNELLQSIKPTVSCIHFSVVDMVEDAIKLLLELSESDIGTPMSRVRQAHFIFRDSFLKPSE